MSLSDSVEEDATLVRVIEEELFLSHADKHSSGDKYNAMSDDQKYLVEQIFPTLVPGLHDLLKCYKNRVSASGDVTAEDRSQPDPVMWLAQYLIRNNAHYKTSRLAAHPFQLVNDAVLNNNQGGV
ncbi:unspecified product [Leptomonas pyrrhocoris]|uniref:Unspecified product n=1 Tax=Leptomonas pyrrhocoris TaxID=157538 RepID=A0A0N1J5B5_LEPPY|nr:unspecified product [Leptomonas pyrrhocoris]KPA84794.1 unspecified product [Leptomonas pyrrhocoris]|eukprot:XP_015663233.1 unspecified product [Leptomonas pyrrhocoris]